MWKLTNGEGDIYILDEISIDQSFCGITSDGRQVIGLPATLTAHIARYEHYPVWFSIPKIKKAIFNDPATIVLWDDGTKTVVKCQDGDDYSKEQGLALCIAKKFLGNKGNYNDIFKRWIHE